MLENDAPRLSYQGLLVLSTFIQMPRKELCGADLIKLTGLSSGTLYPLLLRFEKHRILESYWEDSLPEKVGRPRRRLYKLTTSGSQTAQKKLLTLNPPINNLHLIPAFVGE